MKRFLIAFCALLGLAMLAPSLVVIPVAFNDSRLIEFPPSEFSLRWFENFLTDPRWRDVTVNSMIIASLTSVCACVAGTLTAVGIVRMPERYAQIAIIVVALPLVVPLVVLGLGTYLAFAPLGLLDSRLGLVLAHTALALPYVTFYVMAPLRQVAVNQIRAAESLGAGRVRAWWDVVRPVIMPALVASSLVAFLVSFDEVVIALFLSGVRSKTLPVQMWESVQTQLDPTLAVVAVILFIVISIILLVVSLLFIRSKRLLEGGTARV